MAPWKGAFFHNAGYSLIFSLTLMVVYSYCSPAFGQPKKYLFNYNEALKRKPKIRLLNSRGSSPKFGPDITQRSVLPDLTLFKGKSDDLSSMARVFVQKFVLIGNKIFSSQELATITKPYENREISFEELQDLRRKLTFYYVNKGYINSGVVIPDQSVINGIICLRIIEGRLTTIEISGHKHFRPRYLRNRLSLAAGPPVNIINLQLALQQLQHDPSIKRIHGKLKPGLRPGEGILQARIEEKSPYEMKLKINNSQAPSVGEIRGEVQLAHRNLTGNGDSLESTFGFTEGLNDIDINYTLPITSSDTAVKVRFRKSNSTVIEDMFKPLDIQSRSKTYEITLSRPFYRTFGRELFFSITAECGHNETYLLGQPFPLSSGSKDGQTDTSVLSFVQEWIDRSQIKVMAVRSTFKVGLDVFGATVNDSDVDGKFFSWLGQIQWVRRLKFRNSRMVIRAIMQLTDDSLLPLEKFAVGGMNSVRGYRQNLMVSDNGMAASLEFILPFFRNNHKDGFQLIPFADFGRSWNSKNNTPGSLSISSIGLGIGWAIATKINLQIYGGLPLQDIENLNNDLQDQGLHFQLIGQLL